MPQAKLLVLDIETSPNKGYFWGGLFDNNFGLNQVVEWGGVICFAAKWLGTSKVHFYSDFHDGHAAMVQAAWDLLDEADAVIHYNGKAFDVKHLNREFLLAKLGPPSPFRDIDLLTVARGRFKFSSNKLQHITESLELGSKVEHEGFDLWKSCMEGDAKAWARMKKYNIGDITITEDVYEELKPWIKNHPHLGLYSGEVHSCPTCGGDELQRRGYYRSPTAVFQQYWCKACGAWSRSARQTSESRPNTRAAA